MQKNTLHLIGLALAIFSVAGFLHPSVAELRAAASAARQVGSTVTAPRGPKNPPIKAARAPAITHAAPKTTMQTLLDQSGARGSKRAIAESVLGLLEPACLKKLQTFSVLYNNPKHRGLAGHGVILVSGTVPDSEFAGLLFHEGLGHFRDITCVTGNARSGASAFRDGDDPVWNDDPSAAFYGISWKNENERKQRARQSDFVTGYAYEGDSFEDLAESVTYYLTQENAFRERADKNPVLAQKLAWLEQYMSKKTDVAEGMSWDGEIAWDATKLAFTWSTP